MLTIDKYVTMSPEQWEIVIEGARNPKNSWGRMDSEYGVEIAEFCDNIPVDIIKHPCVLGENDHRLLMTLAKGGPVHAKYRRMMPIWITLTAPLYWWKEFDTYKVGTVANSCSTMHKIHAKEFTLDDFSTDHLFRGSIDNLKETIKLLNLFRAYFIGDQEYINKHDPYQTYRNYDKKDIWWQMIQLLPSSYNQKRTVMISYEVGHNMELWRSNHKLDEWHVFCDFLRSLGYSELMTAKIEDIE